LSLVEVWDNEDCMCSWIPTRTELEIDIWWKYDRNMTELDFERYIELNCSDRDGVGEGKGVVLMAARSGAVSREERGKRRRDR
jgi:hypothetical protein